MWAFSVSGCLYWRPHGLRVLFKGAWFGASFGVRSLLGAVEGGARSPSDPLGLL